MPRGKVEASPYFDMLEGTRALEIGNKSLDTGLIELLTDEINFECSQGRPLLEVAAIMNSMIRSLVPWLDGLSLLVTVLSSRYMYDLLTNFKRNYKVEEADFINRRLHPEGLSLPDTEESAYVNIVLRGFVITLAKSLSVFLKIALDVLYEEEDMTTRSMDLSYFCTTPYEFIYPVLEEAIKYLEMRPNAPSQNACLIHLELVKRMLKISFSMNDSVELFKSNPPANVNYLQEAVKFLSDLKKETFVEISDLLVSRFVQVDCNNRHIPSPNIFVTQEEASNRLITIFQAIEKILHTFSKFKNSSQLLTYLEYNVGAKMSRNSSAVVRGFFQLYFIRDDKSIAGLEETVSNFGIRCMESICLVANSVMSPEKWNLESTSDPELVKNECLQKISHLLDDFDAAFYQKLNVFGNNRCRQRQLLTRNLVTWDSLQFNSENTEVHLFRYGIGDRISQQGSVDQPALSISSYIYYVKLSMMIEVVLSGFEHELYRASEAHIMYWYAGELYAHVHQHLSGRLRDINVFKLAWIHNIPKRVKKAKGAKKDALRVQHQQLVAEAVPILQENIALIEAHLTPLSMLHYYLCRGVSMAIQVLQCLLEPLNAASQLESDEKMYRLRMKPFSSIGTPELPTYARFREANNIGLTLNDLEGQARTLTMLNIAKNIENELESVKKSSADVMENFKNNEMLRERLHFEDNEYMKTWYSGVVNTCDSYIQQLRGLHNFDMLRRFKLRSKKGSDFYFPIYYLEVSGTS